MSTSVSSQVVKQRLSLALEQCRQQLETLAESLPESLVDLASAEESIRRGMLRIGGELLQSWSEVADCRTSPPQCAHCQERMRHKGYVRGSLTTTLGDLEVRRARFRCEHCGAERYPQDECLRFRGHALSWPLAKVVSRLGAQLPFAQACGNLWADYGVSLSKQTAQTVCEHAGAAVVDEEDRQRVALMSLPVVERPAALPDSEISPEKVYLFGDGAMIHAAGDWHEIRVASVAATDAEDVPLTVDHRARFLSCADFGWQLLFLARRAGYHRARLRAFIADGARWLWEVAATHFPDAVQILDWYHLSEHIHQAAAVLHGESSQAARGFSQARLQELWEGRVIDTLRVLQELRKGIRAANKRETLRQLIGYLENNRQRIDYPRYRELGLRIGSGQVEGACKTLVGLRCKQAGMRNWTKRGAEGVLRLRAALQTGHFDQLWTTPYESAA
jgi:Transposase